jgi:integrase
MGLPIPSVKQLARQHAVSTSTAQRAVQLLSQWGLVRVEPGRPTLVAPRAVPAAAVVETVQSRRRDDDLCATQALDLEVRRLGTTVATLRTWADSDDTESLHRLLLGAVKRDGGQPSEIEDYELIVRTPATKPSLRRTCRSHRGIAAV